MDKKSNLYAMDFIDGDHLEVTTGNGGSSLLCGVSGFTGRNFGSTG